MHHTKGQEISEEFFLVFKYSNNKLFKICFPAYKSGLIKKMIVLNLIRGHLIKKCLYFSDATVFKRREQKFIFFHKGTGLKKRVLRSESNQKEILLWKKQTKNG